MTRGLSTIFPKLMMNSRFMDMDRLEDRIAEMPGASRWTEDSPVRFEILKERFKQGRRGPEFQVMPIILPTMLGLRKSLQSVDQNPSPPKTEAPPESIADLEAYLLKFGASTVGYTQVPERWIFRNKAILHTNAVVMSMEMDKVRIETAPSPEAMRAVFEIYRDLGQIANKGADFLRNHGYSAQAGHPLMGQALYPPLGQMAGLGWMGANGMLVTPEHGPRVRLGAIFTSIENLPLSTENEHRWVEEFCRTCQVCVRKCPPEAILSEPLRHENGQITHVINERCFPYFSDYYGCSVCIAVCPFSRSSYDAVKRQMAEDQ
jgi:Pyruvate/2-oxoacid:ferredoxin oxidoreductase delta subunit